MFKSLAPTLRLRLHHGGQAVGVHAAHDPAAGAAVRRGGLAAGRLQRRHRARAHHRARRCPSTRTWQAGADRRHRSRPHRRRGARAHNFAHQTLELGGKTPVIVFDDFDVDQAVNYAAFGAFIGAGQTCVCGSRQIVQRQGLRRFRRQARRQGQGDPDRRPDRSVAPARPGDLGTPAQRVLRLRARSAWKRTAPASWPAAACREDPARPKASSSSRPCSPTSRRACGSSRKRCSGRSSR